LHQVASLMRISPYKVKNIEKKALKKLMVKLEDCYFNYGD